MMAQDKMMRHLRQSSVAVSIRWIFKIALLFNAVGVMQITGQYQNCDQQRLQQCQQDVLRLIDQPTAGYMPTGYQQGDVQGRCSSVRQNLDCLMLQMPSCQGRSGTYQGGQPSGGDLINRIRIFLEKNCDQGGGGWRGSSCYQRNDIRQCESNFGSPSNIASSTTCNAYNNFRRCVLQTVKNSCGSQDLQLAASYLIDKANDLAWSCVADYNAGNINYGTSYNPDRYGQTYGGQYSNQYGSGQYSGSQYGGQYGGQYDRDRDRYGQTQYGQQQYGQQPPYVSTGQQYGGQQYGSGQYGSGQYQGQYGQAGIGGSYGMSDIDRQSFAGHPGSEACVERAAFFVRSCEDTLIQRQRDAREGRSSYDVQRRVCCALFFYRDCISRVVVDRCRDASPIVVDLLMGSRRRDLTVNCREYSRDQCSATTTVRASAAVVISLVMFFALFHKD